MTPDWQLHEGRHCGPDDPMHPEDSHGVIVAKLICRPISGPPCPVIDQCLQHALDHGEIYGVWGGMSQRERQRIRVRRGIPHGTTRGYDQETRRDMTHCDACSAARNKYIANWRREKATA